MVLHTSLLLLHFLLPAYTVMIEYGKSDQDALNTKVVHPSITTWHPTRCRSDGEWDIFLNVVHLSTLQRLLSLSLVSTFIPICIYHLKCSGCMVEISFYMCHLSCFMQLFIFHSLYSSSPVTYIAWVWVQCMSRCPKF